MEKNLSHSGRGKVKSVAPETYGMAVYAKNTHRWLMIQRRHSIGIILITRGKYKLYQIPHLVNTMTEEERSMIHMSVSDYSKFKTLYYEICVGRESHINSAWLRMRSNFNLILRTMEAQDVTVTLKWLWAKGYKKIDPGFKSRESARDCAVRELKEESKVDLSITAHVISTDSVSYSTTSYFGCLFPVTLWVCVLPVEVDLDIVDKGEVEVRDRRWMADEDVISHLNQDECSAFMRVRSIAYKVQDLIPETYHT